MRKKIKDNMGITLISLVITIIVILILASVATYSGIDAIKSSEFTRFTSELKIMQTKVNSLYEKYQNNETINGKEVLTLGEAIDSNESIKQQADIVFTEENSGITDMTGYRYFSIQTINELKIEGISQEFFVNVQKRSVISYLGIEYKGIIYYTLEQSPNGLYNVNYEENKDKPTFDINVDLVAQDQYQVTISNINYNGYIDKWKVRYQKENSEYWGTSEELSFIVKEAGNYTIYLKNGEIESEYQTKYIGYVKDGLVLHYDGILNTRKGQNKETTIWEDLSGNKNDGTLNGGTWQEDCLSFDGDGDYVTADITSNGEVTIEVGVKVNTNSNTVSGIAGWCHNTTDTPRIGIFKGEDKFRYYSTDSSEANGISKKYDMTYNTINNMTLISSASTKNFRNFLNGVKILDVSDTNLATQNTQHLFGIGDYANQTHQYTGVNSLNGYIYYVRVYNKTLTDEEVQINYEIDKNRCKELTK